MSLALCLQLFQCARCKQATSVRENKTHVLFASTRIDGKQCECCQLVHNHELQSNRIDIPFILSKQEVTNSKQNHNMPKSKRNKIVHLTQVKKKSKDHKKKDLSKQLEQNVTKSKRARERDRERERKEEMKREKEREREKGKEKEKGRKREKGKSKFSH